MAIFYYRFIQCPAYGSNIYQWSSTTGGLQDGDVIQTTTSCYTVSTFKPGAGADGPVPSYTIIANCSSCTV